MISCHTANVVSTPQPRVFVCSIVFFFLNSFSHCKFVKTRQSQQCYYQLNNRFVYVYTIVAYVPCIMKHTRIRAGRIRATYQIAKQTAPRIHWKQICSRNLWANRIGKEFIRKFVRFSVFFFSCAWCFNWKTLNNVSSRRVSVYECESNVCWCACDFSVTYFTIKQIDFIWLNNELTHMKNAIR